jgi:hypothetical protein
MGRSWIIVFIVSVLFVWICACSKDTSDRLEGKWQLRQVISDGQTTQVDTAFYNFQTSLFMYQIYVAEMDTMRYCYGFNELVEENSLELELITTSDKNPVSEFIKLTDWNGLKETFVIEKLTGSQLVLSRDDKQYIFRKF